jgi:Leu/Phe-tRNA-protein transferase
MSVAETQRKGVFIPHPPDDPLIWLDFDHRQLIKPGCFPPRQNCSKFLAGLCIITRGGLSDELISEL